MPYQEGEQASVPTGYERAMDAIRRSAIYNAKDRSIPHVLGNNSGHVRGITWIHLPPDARVTPLAGLSPRMYAGFEAHDLAQLWEKAFDAVVTPRTDGTVVLQFPKQRPIRLYTQYQNRPLAEIRFRPIKLTGDIMKEIPAPVRQAFGALLFAPPADAKHGLAIRDNKGNPESVLVLPYPWSLVIGAAPRGAIKKTSNTEGPILVAVDTDRLSPWRQNAASLVTRLLRPAGVVVAGKLRTPFP